MKKFIALAAIGFLIVGCSQEEFVGESQNSSSNGEITFSMSTPNATRGGTPVGGATAAEKLNNNFVVYGFKNLSKEYANGTTDEAVFKRYNVNYVAGTANTTKSNTSNWEYVGYTSLESQTQTIKYWDYSAIQYVFSAISGTGVTPTKTLAAKGKTVYDKGWTVTVPAGGSIADLYASDRKVVTKSTTNYKDEVELTFYSMITKIRFALYETVPGYSVKIDRFYYDGLSTETSTNFAIDGKFKTLDPTKDTELTVTYYDNTTAIENQPKVTYTDSKVKTETYKLFGTNMQAQTAIGTTSNTATYDQDGNLYTCILPYQSQSLDTPEDNILKLKVDYTLKSTDDSGEEIHVTGATACVPTQYTQWKNNFAYTYLFKISDNTSGTTGDPTTDPSGLYPITFDACVVAAEDGIQETVTSVSEPSITTYQNGQVVTKYNEYKAGTIYYTVMNNGVLVNTAGQVSQVYEVHNYGTETLTESVVANYKNNKCVLTEVVAVNYAANVLLADGTYLTFDDPGKCLQFEAKAGKTYAIKYDYQDQTDGIWKKAWKVIMVSGTETAETYSWTDPTTLNIQKTDGSLEFTLNSNSPAANSPVLGALPCLKVKEGSKDVTSLFKVTESGSGKYKVELTAEGIAAGVYNSGNVYTLDFNGTASGMFAVGMYYNLNADYTPVTVVAGNTTGVEAWLQIGGSPAWGDITDVPDKIHVVKVKSKTGYYKVTADADATHGSYTVKIAGKPLTVNVDSYAFSGNVNFTLYCNGDHSDVLTEAAKNLYMYKNGELADVNISEMTGINTSIATITKQSSVTGGYTVVPCLPGGNYTVKYENASSKITVTKYTLAAASASIAKATGSTTLTLTKYDGETTTVIPSVNAVKVYKWDTTLSTPTWSAAMTTGFSLIASGKALVFGNVAADGKYRLEYTVDSKVVAYQEINVTTSTPAKANLGSMGKGNAAW